MTPTGGANGLGVVFKLHPTASDAWTLQVLHAFTGGTDGSTGSAGKLLFRSGHLYGAATAGGVNGKGTVFELTPTTSGEWGFKTLYSFKGQPDAGFPYGALVFDASGNLDGAGNFYGATVHGGADDDGSVYKFTP